MSATRNIGRLMGLVPADGAEPEFSPRQKLRTAISAANAARAELAMISSASAWDGEAGLAVAAADRAVEAAKATLEESKRGTASAFIARALGAPEGVGVPIAQARLELQVSEDELEAAKTARDALRSMIPDVQNKADHAERRVDDAAMAVVVAEVAPHSQKVWAEWRRISRVADDLREQVDYLSRWKIIAPSDQPPSILDQSTGADVWLQALAELKTNADAHLPPIPGAAMATPAKR